MELDDTAPSAFISLRENAPYADALASGRDVIRSLPRGQL
jgi:hypothetical protein